MGENLKKNLKNFFYENGISHNFSCLRIPQQNGVVERKNRSLQEMARTLISELYKTIFGQQLSAQPATF